LLAKISVAFLATSIAAIAPLTAAPATATAATAKAPAEVPHRVDRTLTDSRIDSSSGLARSTFNRAVLWTHNDRGDSARIFSIGVGGGTRGVVKLAGAKNRDIEDIAAGPGRHLWVGDIGDDQRNRAAVQVYRVTEPEKLKSSTVKTTRFNLVYPGGARNAEALLVHPKTGRLFVVSNDAGADSVYRAPKKLSTSGQNLLQRVAGAPEGVTSGAFTPDGKHIVLSSNDRVFVDTAFGRNMPATGKPGNLGNGESLEVARNGKRVLIGSEGSRSRVLSFALDKILGGAPTGPGSEEPETPPTEQPTNPTNPTNPTPAGVPGLGVYNGGAGEKPDETTKKDFGTFPDVANTYYQPKQNINLAYETARINRGTSPNLTITTKGTQLLAGIAKGDAEALAWVDNYVAGLKKLAQVDPDVPVYATLDHEFRVKTKQSYVTGESAKPEVYGKALSVFFKKANAAHKNIRTTYWIVGYDRAFEGTVGNAFTVNPDVAVFDPYANTGSDTVASITRGDLSWIKSQKWYTGQEIGLGEFGMPVKNGDANMAKFFTDVRSQLKAQGIEWAVFFNRTKDNNHKITTGAYPKAVAAFSKSIQSKNG
jgi:hypothetical protein